MIQSIYSISLRTGLDFVVVVVVVVVPGLSSLCALHSGCVPLSLTLQLHREQPDSHEAGISQQGETVQFGAGERAAGGGTPAALHQV